jgi:ferredoxin
MEVEVRFRPSVRPSLHSSPGASPFPASGLLRRVPEGTTLLEAARGAGLPIASACGADGVCGRCGVRVLAGRQSLSPETADEARVKRRNRLEAGLRLACRAAVLGPVEVTASYW